jgi:hypothetical protein
MKSEIVSFRPGSDLMQKIMADCHRRGISISEYMTQLVYGALETQNIFGDLKKSLVEMRAHLANGEDPEELIEVLDALIQILD